VILSCLTGCQPSQETAYFGPTISLDELTSKINANNSQIPTLWARQDFQGTLMDDKHQPHGVSAHGVLLYCAPHDLRIVANDDFGGLLFELGANAEVYWLKVVPQMDTLWWGRMRNAEKPAAVSIPVRPDLIADVLAISTLDANFIHEPYTVMHFDNNGDAYVVDSLQRQRDRLLLRKEIWYDRATLHPVKVQLYDESGRMDLKAQLSDFEPLPTDSADKTSWPLLPTRYDLFFPDSGSTMQFTLRQQALGKSGIPHAGSIQLPNLSKPGVRNVIQVDRDQAN